MHKSRIEGAVRSAGRSLDAEEMAFMVLSDKTERPLRERIAWQLHRDLADSGMIVAQDWHGVDLAILEDRRPSAVVAMESMRSFEAVYGHVAIQRWVSRVQKDLRSARRLSGEGEVYALVVLSHVSDEVPVDLDGVVQYLPRINRSLRTKTSTEVIESARSQLEEGLAEHGDVDYIRLGFGKCWGLRTEVHAYLVTA